MRQQNINPVLSIIIPTLGRSVLIETIESLSRTNMADKIEVLVAGHINDNTVLEKTLAVSNAFARFKHLDISFNSGDSSNKKNAGLRESAADIVVFIDDDVKVPENWPEKIAAPFENPETGMVSGPSLVPDELPVMARLSGQALASGAAGYVAQRYRKGCRGAHSIKWSGIIGCNMAFRKKVLEDMGGFDVNFWPGEEMLAAFNTGKAGYKIIFQPEAALYHYPRASVRGFARQIYGYGATRTRLTRAGLDFEPVVIVPALMITAFTALVVGAFFSKTLFFLLTAAVGLYGAAVAFWALQAYLQSKKTSDLLLMFVIPIMHLAYGIGELAELFCKNVDLSVNSNK